MARANRRSKFDFDKLDFSRLDMAGLTGSEELEKSFRIFETLGDVGALREVFETELGDVKIGAFDQLTTTVAELERTRATADTIYEARIKSLDTDVKNVGKRLAAAVAPPAVRRKTGSFRVGGMVRDFDSGVGLSALAAEAFVKEGETERTLARVVTDAEGNFAFDLPKDDVRGGEDVHIRFLGADGKEIPDTERCVGCRIGRSESMVVDLEASDKAASNLAAGKKLLAHRTAHEASLKAKVAAVREERDASLARLDSEIEVCSQLLEKLELEISGETPPTPGAPRKEKVKAAAKKASARAKKTVAKRAATKSTKKASAKKAKKKATKKKSAKSAKKVAKKTAAKKAAKKTTRTKKATSRAAVKKGAKKKAAKKAAVKKATRKTTRAKKATSRTAAKRSAKKTTKKAAAKKRAKKVTAKTKAKRTSGGGRR